MHQLINKKFKIYLYILILLFLSTFYSPNTQSSLNNFFKIKYIHIFPDEINIKEISNLYNQNILKIDIKILNKIIERYPFIKHLQIKKIYPNTIKVNFVPAVAIAKIYINNEINYLGDNSKIFQSKTKKNFIPLILGENDVKKSVEIIRLLKTSSFKQKNIKIIKIYPTKRFDLILNDETVLKFPINSDLDIFEKGYSYYINKNLKSRTIDLRLPNKIIINEK